MPTFAGEIDQVTAVLPVLITVAVNCFVCCAYKVALAGLTLTDTWGWDTPPTSLTTP